MTVILIESPVSTITSSGHKVVVTGINPTSTDCIVGKFIDKNGCGHEIIWDLNGKARDHSSEWNLTFEIGDTITDVRETALALLHDDVKRFF